MPQTYKVIVSGTSFLLTKDQLLFDSPDTNILSTFLLLADSPLSSTGAPTTPTDSMVFQTDSVVFQVIFDYLRGYPVYPLPEKDTGVVRRRLEFIRRDADFFGLERLVALTDEAIKANKARMEEEDSCYDAIRDLGERLREKELRVRELEMELERVEKARREEAEGYLKSIRGLMGRVNTLVGQLHISLLMLLGLLETDLELTWC